MCTYIIRAYHALRICVNSSTCAYHALRICVNSSTCAYHALRICVNSCTCAYHALRICVNSSTTEQSIHAPKHKLISNTANPCISASIHELTADLENTNKDE